MGIEILNMSEEKILQDKVFKVKIKGDTFNVYLVPEDDNDIVDDGSLAETVFQDKEIYFKEASLRIVRHEILHVFISYTYTDTAELTPLQQEEMFCELMSYELDNYIEVVKQVYTGLNKLKEE